MCLSNVYENSVEQKNLILSNVQRIDCKDGFVVLYDLFERETRVEATSWAIISPLHQKIPRFANNRSHKYDDGQRCERKQPDVGGAQSAAHTFRISSKPERNDDQ